MKGLVKVLTHTSTASSSVDALSTAFCRVVFSALGNIVNNVSVQNVTSAVGAFYEAEHQLKHHVLASSSQWSLWVFYHCFIHCIRAYVH